MLKYRKRLHFLCFLLVSLVVHTTVLSFNSYYLDSHDITFNDPHKFNLNSIRTVGNRKSKKEHLAFIKTKQKAKLKDLAFKQAPVTQKQKPAQGPYVKKAVKKKTKKIVKAVKINRNDIRNFLKTPSPGQLSPAQALHALADTDIDIKLEVPKGILEDELNKHELVFYSFQRRTALAYVNAFYKELNQFERQNPHLRFPLTAQRKKLSGKIIYDKDGNIVRIQTLQWTNIKKLNVFFEELLKNLNKLPNPPKEIVDNEQFAVNFVLTLNQ